MHNNYYFLRQLSPEIEKRITGYTLVSCFSQNKDELITEFNNGEKSFFIKASLLGDFQCLSFPASFHRARKNSADLFNGLLMLKVRGVRQFSNERSIGIELENGQTLVYKMHAARANVIWFDHNGVVEIFRNNFNADLELNLQALDRTIDWTQAAFMSNLGNPKSLYFTFGKPVWEYVETHGFATLTSDQQWKFLQEIKVQLEQPELFISNHDGNISLSLLPVEDSQKIDDGPVEALNAFFNQKVSTSVFQREKSSLFTLLQGNLKQADAFLVKTQQKLKALEIDAHYQEWADLIMANLHAIKPGSDKITLPDFHDDQRLVEIKLKKELSPQKNAETYYKKAKNKIIEINTLKNSIDRKKIEVDALHQNIDHTGQAKNLTELREISSDWRKKTPDIREKASVPYHEFEFKGFKIWVGKNAAANDTLTQKHGFKDDLWLHAKDVAGSHVLIKYQSGKPFPKDVIMRAAQLAAFYSKRKNESLCPVAVTPKKFVRKRKGDPAGMVVVEREDVMMVEPVGGIDSKR